MDVSIVSFFICFLFFSCDSSFSNDCSHCCSRFRFYEQQQQ